MRTVTKTIALVLALNCTMLSTVGCGNTESASSGRELVVVDWGGTNTDARIEANFSVFEKEHDCTITVVTPCDYKATANGRHQHCGMGRHEL